MPPSNGTTKKPVRNTEQLLIDFQEVAHVPTTYINNSLSAVGTHAQITDSVQTLLEDLEAASSIASKKLNALVDDMLRTAPRLGYDVELLRGNLQNMHALASKTEPKRELLSAKGESSIKKLAMLETVKQKMQETQRIFDDARAWSPPESIEETIGVLIAAKEYTEASKQVLHYDGLLQVYKGTSEYVRRKAVMDRIRKKLLDARQDSGLKKKSLELGRPSIDSLRSGDSGATDEGYYSSFIKRAFKT